MGGKGGAATSQRLQTIVFNAVRNVTRGGALALARSGKERTFPSAKTPQNERPDLSPAAVTSHSSGGSRFRKCLRRYFPASGFDIFFFFVFFAMVLLPSGFMILRKGKFKL